MSESEWSQSPWGERGRVVDLFAGPGGLDVAATWLGLHVDGLEWDENACATREAAGLSTYYGDVRDRGPQNYPEATILAGGPPCQTYTVAGSGSGRKALDQVKQFADRMKDGDATVYDDLRSAEDPRTPLVLEPLRWILEAHRIGRPFRQIVLEQVPTVRHVWAKYKEILEGLRTDGLRYNVDFGVLRTEEFGIPQTRRRAILVASLDDQVLLPEPTHQLYVPGVPRAGETDPRGIHPWVPMGEALPHRGSFEVISNYGTGGDPKLRGRRKSEQPSATVTGKISRNRLVDSAGEDLGRFTIGEAGRLQTFPLDFPWSGRDQAQQIGNAIPPRLGVHVLAAVLGLEVKDNDIDAAVDGEWENTKRSQPLANSAPKRRAESETPTLFD